MMTPLVLSMAVSTAVFPTMAEESASNHGEAVRDVFCSRCGRSSS